MSKELNDAPIKLAYTNTFDQYNHLSKKTSCLNHIEFSYHPLNYKKNKCKEYHHCKNPNCPFFHSGKEDKIYESFRAFLITNEQVKV